MHENLRIESEILTNWTSNAGSPLVSIVCITYNHEKFIGEAINGFLAQRTDFSFEVVIGDDCSTDETTKIIEKYASQYSAIIKPIIRDKNIGISANLIDCFNACAGSYIAICEGDDYWTAPEKIQTQIDLMKQHPDINISFHPSYAIENHKLQKDKIFSNYGDKVKVIPLNDIILGGGGFMPTQSLILRAGVLKNPPDWFYKYPIDYFIQILGSVGNGGLYIPSIFSAYRVNAEGSWSLRQRVASVQTIKENLEKEKKSLLALKGVGVSEDIINKAIAISTFKAFTRKFKIYGLIRTLITQSKYIESKQILFVASLFFSPFIKLAGKIKTQNHNNI